MARQPYGSGPYPSDLTVCNVDGMGARTYFPVQRRLPADDFGQKASVGAGQAAAEVWSEIWKDIGPRIQRVMETGQASWDEELPLILERNGYPEETYHTFSYSPLAGADGRLPACYVWSSKIPPE